MAPIEHTTETTQHTDRETTQHTDRETTQHTDRETTQHTDRETVVEETLVEEVSIDGMCGVY